MPSSIFATPAAEPAWDQRRFEFRHWYAIVFSAALGLSGLAGAATVYNVNSTADAIDDNTADGTCHTTAGTCTLRAAIMQANTIADDATINVPAGTYVLTLSPSGADSADSGDLNLAAPVSGVPLITISGAGQLATVIDGNATDRVISVAAGRHATITGVRLQNGNQATGNGGGVDNEGGILTISDSTIAGNSAGGLGGGAGIYNANSGNLTLDNVTISGNTTSSNGGGLYVLSGTAHLTGCMLTGNHADGGGGAIFNDSAVTVTGGTVSANTSGQNGGGIFIFGSVTLDHATVIGNTAYSYGGGVYVETGGGLIVNFSTVATNTAFYGGGIYDNSAGAMYIDSSTIAANIAELSGGIEMRTSSSMFMTNSTVSGNASHGAGGGFTNRGTCNVYNSTIAFNRAWSNATAASAQGGGVYNLATFNLHNTIVARNSRNSTPVDDDCEGTLGIYGNNRFGTLSGCTAAAGSSGSATLLGSAGELAPLAGNGGPTRTHALVPPSDMIDGAQVCSDRNGNVLSVDQRGHTRPIGASCDVGAFEYDSGDIFADGFEY